MHFDSTQMVSIFDAGDEVTNLLKADLVPYLHGSPGIGKSGLAKTVAKNFNLKLIDIRIAQMDPADLNGLPDLAGDRATFKAFDTFPLEDTPIPTNAEGQPYNGWLILLDEMSSADDQRQAAAYKLVLDRMVGDKPLHSKVRMMAAGNLDTDSAIVNVMSSAMVSRLAHLGVQCNLNQWLDRIAYPNKYDSRITAFLEFKSGAFYTFDPNNPTQPYSCPRTWEAADKYLKVLMNIGTPLGEELDDAVRRAAMGGIIGHGSATELKAFLKYQSQLPTRNDVLTKPTEFNIPLGNPGVMYALTGMLSDMIDEQNAETVMKAIERMPSDYKVVTLRAAIKRRGIAFMSIPVIAQWTRNNADLIR